MVRWWFLGDARGLSEVLVGHGASGGNDGGAGGLVF